MTARGRSELVLNDADIVFGKARVIDEAMASGRAAYVFDENGGEGWVTPRRTPISWPTTSVARAGQVALDEHTLAAGPRALRPDMGTVNRNLTVTNHAATKHAAALVSILERLAPRTQPVDAPVREIARLVRV